MWRSYDEDAALMVEEVLREMFIPYRPEHQVLQAYFGEGMTLRELAKEQGVHHTTIYRHRMPMAQRIFSEQWGELIRKTPIKAAMI